MKEAPYGTLSWFAGIFWLIVSLCFHKAATLAHRLELRVALPLARAAAWSGMTAVQCAIDGGAEE